MDEQTSYIPSNYLNGAGRFGLADAKHPKKHSQPVCGGIFARFDAVTGGYPVIVELGLDPPGEYRWMGWYGHYLLLVAYDDETEQFWAYDSWFGASEVPVENVD